MVVSCGSDDLNNALGNKFLRSTEEDLNTDVLKGI